MKSAEKLNIARSQELFKEALQLVPGGSWAPENPLILSKANTPSFWKAAGAVGSSMWMEMNISISCAAMGPLF